MTGKYLLVQLGNIDQKYYDEAENDTIDTVQHSYKSTHKLLLIAAIIALTALLVGFTVVRYLRLQDMSVGKDTITQNFNEQGLAIDPTEVEVDVITLYGHNGDPIQQALAEWFKFLETYDPEMKLADNVPDHPEIPNVHEMNYHCYTLDMAKKVDEIAAKYKLKLLDESVLFQQWQSDIFFEETGIGSFLLPDSNAQITNVAGLYYPPYNFDMDFRLFIDALQTKLSVSFEYVRKDYFPSARELHLDLNTYTQWNYAAPDGRALLLAVGNKGNCYIFAEQKNAMLIVRIDGNLSGSLYPGEDEILTRSQLEAIAELFDYSIQPQSADMDVVKQRMDEADAAYWEVPEYEPAKYGSFSDYIKGRFTLPDNDLQYTFLDIIGDEQEELLIGQDGQFSLTLTVMDGEVMAMGHSGFYLCENGILESGYAFEIFEEISYYTKEEIYTNGSGYFYHSWDPFLCLTRTRDQWGSYVPGIMDSDKDLTEEEVQAIMGQYPRIELEWYPFMDYPLSEDQTLGEYLETKDVRVSDEELLDIYREYVRNHEDSNYIKYRILDINGDGVDDLLLKSGDIRMSEDNNTYNAAVTYRYGKTFWIAAYFYLCEDNVLEVMNIRPDGLGGKEREGHQFQRIIGLEEELYELVVYSGTNGKWMADWWNEQPITDEEAEAILAKYPRIDQGMRPISELLG